MKPEGLTIWTVGHSTRSLEDFIKVLEAFDIELMADVRRFPGSRRQPHFGQVPLDAGLRKAGIETVWLPSLGGRRQPTAASVNTGWRVPGFRGYADHIASEEFAGGLFELLMLAEGLRTAIMCAELLWWRCHRRLISDVLVSIGAPVMHIRDAGFCEPHSIVDPARLVDGVLTYEADTQLGLFAPTP